MCRLHPEVSFQEDEAMQLTHGQRSIGDDLNPDFYAGRKLGEMEQALLWSLLQAEPECPSRVLLDKAAQRDRKSTRLNSSHGYISYAVFCLKKKKKIHRNKRHTAN